MITIWSYDHQKAAKQQLLPGQKLPANTVWIDLFSPSEEERTLVQSLVGFPIPTMADMQEIEQSNRIRVNAGVFTLTIPAVTLEGDTHQSGYITFVLSSKLLTTIRTIDPRGLSGNSDPTSRQISNITTPEEAFLTINESLISHTADALERVEKQIESLTSSIFAKVPAQQSRIEELGGMSYVMHTLGQNGNLVMKVRHSIEWLERILNFLKAEAQYRFTPEEMKRIDIDIRDLHSLASHTNFIEQQASFVLDAALGMIEIDQNESIRWFTVISTVFMPPTLIASIYGMNFHNIPEIAKPWGYPMALVLILGSAIFSFLYFRRKGWV
ncbi:MAG TPA: hypothetical protein DCW68_06435 [Rhodospirillaceae bacterium]|nr:MAG: hypothetical protein A2018_03790 [Alphaproteobacteria bacterium GWF2_58_20]HAU29726.1 hypothetical protein [Rhodospirillaceae bacterium]